MAYNTLNKLAVKNKMPAPVQVTAEQILRDAAEWQAREAKPTPHRLVDDHEMLQHRIKKRKDFEDMLRRQRHHIGTWIKYAVWEAAQKDFRRARSIFERALNVDYKNTTLWQRYIEMEVKNKFLNSARNLYDRVTGLLPRADQFWFRYAHMEELLGNYAAARKIFDRWMEWNPDDKAWMMYIHFEERCGELNNCRSIFERYLENKPCTFSFLKFCKFEERYKNYERCRAGFKKAIELLPPEVVDQTFYDKYAQFEQRRRNFTEAKNIYELGLRRLPKEKSQELYNSYVLFQKHYGTDNVVEEAILNKRRKMYKEQLERDPRNYDVWFDYIRLEESLNDNVERIRSVYKSAIENTPTFNEKKAWRRYIYLWIYYALFEEMVAKDIDKTREIFDKALSVLPNKKFTFTKLYTLFAEFEIRQHNLDLARKVLGRGLGECKKGKLFESYAALELRLGNLDRCRVIYAKYIETHPFDPKSWIAFIDFELMVQEVERARALCESAVDMDRIDSPELIWKTFIDLEVNLGEISRARNLYERLLIKTQHYKVFKGYAEFEYKQVGDIVSARRVIERGLEHCKINGLNEERALLLVYLLKLEKSNKDDLEIAKVMKRQAKKVKHVNVHDGVLDNIQEYVTYIFPDDGIQEKNLKILEAAKKWKKQQNNK